MNNIYIFSYRYFGHIDVSVTSAAFFVATALLLQRGNPRFSQLSSTMFGLFYCGYLPSFWVKLRCGLAAPTLNTSKAVFYLSFDWTSIRALDHVQIIYIWVWSRVMINILVLPCTLLEFWCIYAWSWPYMLFSQSLCSALYHLSILCYFFIKCYHSRRLESVEGVECLMRLNIMAWLVLYDLYCLLPIVTYQNSVTLFGLCLKSDNLKVCFLKLLRLFNLCI